MLDEVCSEGTAKASLDNPQAVKNILITPQFKLQVPYSHISAMIQRVLKARPYPSVGELKSLV